MGDHDCESQGCRRKLISLCAYLLYIPYPCAYHVALFMLLLGSFYGPAVCVHRMCVPYMPAICLRCSTYCYTIAMCTCCFDGHNCQDLYECRKHNHYIIRKRAILGRPLIRLHEVSTFFRCICKMLCHAFRRTPVVHSVGCVNVLVNTAQ